MKNDLLRIIDEFGGMLTREQYNQYIPKLRDYLIPYIIKSKAENLSADRIFKDEFTRNDIINATIFYVENNENVYSLSAIDDYLIAINRLFDKYLFEKYQNTNLMKYRPFTSFSDEIEKALINKKIELKSREVYPSINEDEYKFILEYLSRYKKKSIKSKQVSIIIKLYLLYGFSHDKIASLKRADYCSKRRNLRINYRGIMTRNIYLELPYKLSNEINEYLAFRDRTTNLNSDLLFVNENNRKISNDYSFYVLSDIKKRYIKDEISSEKNQFTPTGLQKYGIIQMILNGMNQSVIMDFSGQKIDIYADCQNEVNRIKRLDRNRYINHIIRGISIYDDI